MSLTDTQRVYVMVLDESGRADLSERAKSCMNHHHGCDCREAHWATLVASLEAERDKLKALNEHLRIDLLQSRNELAQLRINVALADKEKMDKAMKGFTPPEGISVSSWCAKTHIQLCHCCDDLECVDNLKNELNTRKTP